MSIVQAEEVVLSASQLCDVIAVMDSHGRSE